VENTSLKITMMTTIKAMAANNSVIVNPLRDEDLAVGPRRDVC
jgi:hypothetical protein